ncbi:ribosomal RNA processing protein 36 homolog [Dreissena polymorpha]|uniref:rRNA biogenesis protein RRP36 n=1 Tax=Dreissena polymorpha TaxID=45954 RepID=A0A9D4L3R3_DREPO|nr:ribosomal RNA processing protein 36 homolog [Dreissena polymorpha]KAH3850729.1 hypothetical protein DPMN_093202 [Dreissena polymorpha]
MKRSFVKHDIALGETDIIEKKKIHRKRSLIGVTNNIENILDKKEFSNSNSANLTRFTAHGFSDSDGESQEINETPIVTQSKSKQQKLEDSVKYKEQFKRSEPSSKAMEQPHIKHKPNVEDFSDGAEDGSDKDDDDDFETTSDHSDISDDGKIGEESEPQEHDEMTKLKNELSSIPLEDLMKIKDKLGLKTFNKIMHGEKFEQKNRVFRRENKNRPMEVSSKKRVGLLRHHHAPKEKIRRDPRFDDLSGEFKEDHFSRNFSFLEEVKAKEKLLIKKKLKKTKNEEKKMELTKLYKKMTQREQTEEKQRKRMELEHTWKAKEKQLVKEGKAPYFLKKSDKKKLELAEKYKELQKSGKVDQYLMKKRKKNAQKMKKKLPGRHERFS